MWTVYKSSKIRCVFCDRAITLLLESGAPLTVRDIATDPEAMEFFRASGHQTVPLIFEGDTKIGGLADLARILKQRSARE